MAKLLAFVRKCSTTGLTKPPISISGIDGRYVTAIYSAACKDKCLEKVEQDLAKLYNVLKTDEKFRTFLLNPTIDKNNKNQILKTIATKLELHPQTTNLLELLVENKRLNILNKIAEKFSRVMIAHRKEVETEVITAAPLQEDHKKQLEAALQKFLKGEQKLKLNYKINPEIMGGMVVKMGDLQVDMSTITKLKKFEKVLKAPI